MPATPPSWDLSDLFTSPNDPRIERLFVGLDRRCRAFVKTTRDKLTRNISAHKLLKAIQTYESILQDLIKPEIYAHLLFTTHAADQSIGAFLQRMKTRTTAIAQQIVFFDVELSQMSTKQLKQYAAHPVLQNYRHYLQLQLLAKPHRLSEVEEKIMNDKSLTGRSALIRLFNEELSTKAFRYTVGAKSETKTEDQMLHLLYDANPQIRQRAAKQFTDGLREEQRRLTFVTNTLIQDKEIDDRYRKYESPETSRHLENEISQPIVDAMVAAVTKSYPIVQEYYRFKQRTLTLKRLHDYDRYAPIAKTSKTFTYDEARDIVLEAFGHFSPAMAKTAKQFFDKNWIDAAPKTGKQGGAYCMFVTPDLHPYVLTNFHGNTKDVMTLAHELGHAIHACRARKQSYLNFNMPLTVAETASIFGEMLVFDDLRKKIDAKDRLALIMGKLEQIFASVHRQTSMYLFEKDLHAEGRANGEQTVEKISAIWRKRQLEMFGTSVTLTSDYDLWWSYIPHFIHTPFYVYAYAFGELLTLSLFAQYKKQGAAMVQKYHAMLDAGGSIAPSEMVKPFGINLSDPTFWNDGIAIINQLLGEAKQLQAELTSPKPRRRFS